MYKVLTVNSLLILLQLFAGFFDTNVGRKSESYSYMKIAQIIGCTTSDILFLTDVVKGNYGHFNNQ